MGNDNINEFRPKVILWGGTGQAKVVRPIIEHFGARVVAIFDDTPHLEPPFSDVGLFCGYEGFKEWITLRNRSEIGFCITIGNPYGRVRVQLHEKLEGEGLLPVTIVHPDATIAHNAKIGDGSQILAGAIIGPEARLGRECIVNTNASVDHEDVLGDGVEIAPGATLCGLVKVGVNGWICAGATILPRINVGDDAIVGAGAVVTEDVPDGITVAGVPARPIRERKT